MTNQQSIDRLLSLSLWLDKDSELYQAIVMAISALKAQEAKTQLSAEGTTTKVKKTCMRNPADRWKPQELSKNSPKLEKENGDLQPTCNQLATDTISRTEAIDEIKALYEWHDTVTEDRAIDHLKRLPSAQPDRKTGWWLIREGISDAQCSECGMYFNDVYDMENSDAFCRHCGTKMEGLKVVEDE